MYWIQSVRADVSKSPSGLRLLGKKRIVTVTSVDFCYAQHVHCGIPFPPLHIPSSIPTWRHQGVSEVGLTILSASPTWRLALTSRPLVKSPPPLPALLFSFIAMLESVKLGISLCCLPTRVNPWDEREATIPEPPAWPLPRLCEDPFIHSSLMTGRCHCSGSELDDKRFKCRYTSVP
jgi:hypothetical protein